MCRQKWKKTHIASVSGLKSAEICRHAFEEDLKQELSKDTEACKIERWSVQTRPFKYEEEYPDETVEKRPCDGKHLGREFIRAMQII